MKNKFNNNNNKSREGREEGILKKKARVRKGGREEGGRKRGRKERRKREKAPQQGACKAKEESNAWSSFCNSL